MVPSGLRSSALSVLGVALIVGCSSGGEGNGTDPPPGPAPVAVVEVAPTSVTINVGEQTQLNATTKDASGNTLTGRAVAWSSSNASVASVSTSGQVTGEAAGSATITATSEGVSGSATVDVVDPPVASVTVTPDPAAVVQGRTVQLTAAAMDAQGQTLSGKAFQWASADESIATVDQAGLVTGVSPGSVQVTATSEGVSGSATVNVTAPSPVMISSVTPDPMVEGQNATITGTGFGQTAGENAVTIDGLAASVTAASETSLTVTVPTGVCKPARSAQVQVTVGTQVSNAVAAALHPPSFLDMDVGDHMLIPAGSDFCLQFEALVGLEEYLFGVTSLAATIGTLTPYTVSAEASNLAPPRAPSVASAPRQATSTTEPAGPRLRSSEADPHLLRWAEHAVHEARIMEEDMRALGPHLRSADFDPHPTAPAAVAAIPGNAMVGEQYTIRFGDRSEGKNPLQDFIELTVEIKKVSDEAIFASDVDNPAEIPIASYDGFADDFDDVIHGQITSNFGSLSDIDGNGRVLVIHTKEVNKLDSPPLAFVQSVDLFPDSLFAASNNAEAYYARSPDPTGMFNAGAYTVDDALKDFRVLLAHEGTHIIQLGTRLFGGAPAFPESFILESGATAAQEIVGFAFEGRTDGQNYDRAAVNPNLGADPNVYYSYLTDLGVYFGRNAQDVNKTPHECSWVTAQVGTQPGPCNETFGTRLPYGVPWSLIQYWIQRKGLSKTTVHRAITASHATGFAVFEGALGETMPTMLADWAPMLYLDDQAGINKTTFATWQFTNWNIPDVLAGWFGNDPNAQLRPRNRSFTGFQENVSVRAGSTVYFMVVGAARPAVAIKALEAGSSLSSSIHQLFVVRTK